MVLNKFTKKRLKIYGGASKAEKEKQDNKESNEKIAATVTDKDIKDFKNSDYPKGWIVHDLYLAAPVKTEKDYIKQAIVVKRKKAEKKVKEEKMSTVTGIQTLKKSEGGIFDAVTKGIKEGQDNFNKIMQGAQSIGRAVTLKGKYGSMIRGKASKARAASVKASDKYKRAKKDIQDKKERAIKQRNTQMRQQIQSFPAAKKLGLDNPSKMKKYKDDSIIMITKLQSANRLFKEDILFTFSPKINTHKNIEGKFKQSYSVYKGIKQKSFKTDNENFIQIYEQSPDALKSSLSEGNLGSKELIKSYILIVSNIYLSLIQFMIEYKFRANEIEKHGSGEDKEKDKKRKDIQKIHCSLIKKYWKDFSDNELEDENNYSLKYLVSRENYKKIYKKIIDERNNDYTAKLGPATKKLKLICYYGYKFIDTDETKSGKIYEDNKEVYKLKETVKESMSEIISSCNSNSNDNSNESSNPSSNANNEENEE